MHGVHEWSIAGGAPLSGNSYWVEYVLRSIFGSIRYCFFSLTPELLMALHEKIDNSRGDIVPIAVSLTDVSAYYLLHILPTVKLVLSLDHNF